ncbi:MAG: hypothetical protein KIT18_14700 [Burkholderiales bacterium]|nr:hypothetical protein [Burkholderiales bacterium]
MWRIFPTLLLFALAGCAQLPPTPQDIQAKKFEAVPGKAVVYIVRESMDSPLGEMLWLGDDLRIATHPRTYYRWETDPGTYRITGFGPWSATVTVKAEAGKIYFVEHSVRGNFRDGVQQTFLRLIPEQAGRALVGRSELL